MGYEIGFNNRVLDSLKPPKNRARNEYRDRNERGLFLFVTQTGTKTFYLYLKHRKRPLRKKIGRYPEMSVSAARLKVRDLKAQLSLGGAGLQMKSNDPADKITLRELAELYLDTKSSVLKDSTIAQYRSKNSSILRSWMDLPIASISKDRVVHKHKDLTMNCGKHAADSAMQLFRAYFRFFADRYDYTGVNPVRTLSQNRLWNTKTTDRRTNHIKNDELAPWIDAVNQLEPSPRDFMLILLFTGMRKNEAQRLRWDRVDFEKRIITVPDTKNRDDLVIPISDYVYDLLERRHINRLSELVFPSISNPDKPLVVNLFTKFVYERFGLKYTLHDLRRTFITIADSLGISLVTIKRLVNHRVGKDVTEGYIITDIDQLREPVQRITDRILELAEQVPIPCEPDSSE